MQASASANELYKAVDPIKRAKTVRNWVIFVLFGSIFAYGVGSSAGRAIPGTLKVSRGEGEGPVLRLGLGLKVCCGTPVHVLVTCAQNCPS